MSSDTADLLFEGGAAGADIYYASGFLCPDPFALLVHDGARVGVLSDLEIGRAAKEGSMDELVSLQAHSDALKAAGNENPRIHDVLARVLGERGIARLVVPEHFPFGLAEKLRGAGFEVSARDTPFFPERDLKRPDEIAWIGDNQRNTERALALAIQMIADAEVGAEKMLMLAGEPLTSERVKHAIQVELLADGLLAGDTIVAGGDQGCDPHCMGSGPLYAEQTIILDVFPRSLVNQYWADITRTVYKGSAPDEIHQLHEAVAAAQTAALEMIAPGVEGPAVHGAVKAVFAERGYETGKNAEGAPRGFIHGTGHGLGLEIHERPRISDVPATLRAGMVVTVEPGLYYPGLGGVRIEDLVVVTEAGIDNLTSAPKVLEV